MAKLVTLTLTDTDCLSLRLALNATAIEWGDKARAALAAGDDKDADTCQRIRSDYHRLWDMVNAAQEAGGREPNWLARREATADAMFASEARETDDRRYEHVRCATCGKNWQRIDWGSVAHAYFCDGAKTAPSEARETLQLPSIVADNIANMGGVS